MAVLNVISGNLTAYISEHLPQFLVASNITLSPIIMKETGQDLIKKILYLIISRLTEIIFWFHQTETLKNLIKLSLKNVSLCLTLIYLQKIFLKIN